MNAEEIKYTRVEYERRFLVPPQTDWRNNIEPYSKTLEDKYLHGTRLRLRRLKDSDSDRQIIKLTKKFESASPFYQTISRILLSPDEYSLFSSLEGDRLKKVRYYHQYLGRIYSIDVFEGELNGLVLCETEAENLEKLMAAEPPAYAKYEVTTDPFFNGGNLCRTRRTELERKLAAFR